MTNCPKISIIIPVYMMEKYLGACLESVLNQTFTDFECLCVNDGSTDRSLAILQEYAQKDPRIKVVDQPNQGGSVARNNGLDLACGEYIAFLDNDDLYYPQYLEALYHYVTTYDADIAVCNYGSFFDDSVPELKHYDLSSKPKLVSDRPFFDYIVKRKKIHMLMWTKLYKRQVLDGIRFSMDLPAINDVLFHLETLLNAHKVVTCPYCLITHRMIASAQSSQKLTLKKLEEYTALITLVDTNILPKVLSAKEQKYLKLFITKNAYYNFVYIVLKFNSIQATDAIFQNICKRLDTFEEKKLIFPRMLKIQDWLIYMTFKTGKLEWAMRLLRIRNFLARSK